MTSYFDSPLWRMIFGRLKNQAILTPADTEFQPSEAEMRSVIEELYESPAVLRAARSLHPNFDALTLQQKYHLLVAIEPRFDVAQNKMQEAEAPVLKIDVPYTGYASGQET